MFLVPSRLSTGGVSGIATALYLLFGIPLSITTLFVNALLFVVGFKTLQRASVLKTAVGILLFSVFLWLSEFLASLVPRFIDRVSEDVWACAIFGGALAGFGIGVVVLQDASTGGSDFAALMLHKRAPHISVAAFIMIIDTVIIVISGIILGDYLIIFYSIASLFISNKITDMIMVGGNKGISVCVISKRNDVIAWRIMAEIERGVTSIYSRGYYEGYDAEMLMCIVRTKEVPKILNIVRDIDPCAFTVISEVKEVRGLGFKEE